jgi:UDPglucose 6-dehydrogenase
MWPWWKQIPPKLKALRGGHTQIYEPGLDQLVAENVEAGRLVFTDDLSAVLEDVEVVFIAVGTPTRRGDGHADLSYLYAAAEQVARSLAGYAVIVTSPRFRSAPEDALQRSSAGSAPTSISTSPQTRNSCGKEMRSATSCGPTAW